MGLMLRWVLFWFLAPAAALAQDLSPAEMPPSDFTARQYIDSRGCVFLRDDSANWAPRLARDGSPICGYPPTLSVRGIEGRPRLSALDPDAGKTRSELVEQALSNAVLTNLRPGELVSDQRELETLPDMGPEPASSQPMDQLKAALRAAPAVREGMSRDIKPNRRLCELLGYDGKAVHDDKIGGDPTTGFCGSLPDSDLSRLSFARPVGSALPSPSRVAPAVRAERKAAPAPRVATVPAPARKVAAQPVVAVRKPVPPNVPMIPPGARYVQIGTYSNTVNADRAVQRVAGMGYPVLRGRDRAKGAEVQFIMAGPFDSREKIVRALDGLRKAGFRDAYPR